MKYGFIGCGNMGGAIARAISSATKEILISDPSSTAKALAAELGCSYGSNDSVAAECDRIFLAVKPQLIDAVLSPLATTLAKRKPLIITMAAGIEIQRILSIINTELPVVRIMPNTPVAIGKGMILYCHNGQVDEQTLCDLIFDMRFTGCMEPLAEQLIDTASALSGSGPAYAYLFMEALADGAVACGLPRDKAIKYAAITLEGAAQMLLQTQKHPGELKDAVCSPGGSTIAGIHALERKGFRGAVIDCVKAAYEKNKLLGK